MAPRLSKTGKRLGRPPNPVPAAATTARRSPRAGKPPKILPAFLADKERRARRPRASDANLVTKPAARRKPRVAVNDAPKLGRTTRKATKKDGTAKKAFPLIARNDLRRLLEEAAILNNRASSANGSRSELIGQYVKNKHLHAGAFRIISHWAKLGEDDPQKLWLELAHVDDMREKSGLDRIAKAQGQLLPAIADEPQKPAEPASSDEPDEADNEPEAASAEPKDERVNYPPREVPERAGEVAA